MTGKGVRWGRDRIGRSAPAFLSANTFALPPPTCTARDRRHLRLVVCCKAGHLWPCVLRPEPGGGSAGCVCLQCLVQQAVFCLPCPLPFSTVAPVQVLLAPSIPLCFAYPRSCHVLQDHRLAGPAVCLLVRASSLRATNCPVGSCNTGLQWRPVHRSIC